MNEKRNFYEKYKAIAKSEWFKEAYHDKVLGIELTVEPMKEKKDKLEILADATLLDEFELYYKNEVQVVRPSEALEAMDEYAKQQTESLQAQLDIEKQKVRNLEHNLYTISNANNTNR
jgi:hypothetical protein